MNAAVVVEDESIDSLRPLLVCSPDFGRYPPFERKNLTVEDELAIGLQDEVTILAPAPGARVPNWSVFVVGYEVAVTLHDEMIVSMDEASMASGSKFFDLNISNISCSMLV
ncbi:uncharacterized protein A4U43_C07F710 [Asparagus officinalis]|uniref:Uncharacterized protein n=1 Tax=Asparagus officinalis TaxID=4686 RepID=A0A5P1E8A5_ASPOF|nr:uncharacterized protein A4U43_C07F710 [Asparagus officinalis]